MLYLSLVCFRFIRRRKQCGRQSHPRDLSSDSDSEVLASGMEEEPDVMKQWFENSHSTTWHSLLASNKLAVRWLPPGNPMSLYHEYAAVQSIHQRRCVSSALRIRIIGSESEVSRSNLSTYRWSTFLRAWKQRWHRYLHFRQKSMSCPQYPYGVSLAC